MSRVKTIIDDPEAIAAAARKQGQRHSSQHGMERG